MKIRLTRDWNGYKQGRELSPPDGVANLLVRRGLAVVMEPVIETADAKPFIERAARRVRGR